MASTTAHPELTTARNRLAADSLSLWEVARRIGLHPSKVSRIFSGRAQATVEQLVAIAEVVAAPPEALFPELRHHFQERLVNAEALYRGRRLLSESGEGL